MTIMIIFNDNGFQNNKYNLILLCELEKLPNIYTFLYIYIYIYIFFFLIYFHILDYLYDLIMVKK